MNPRESWARFLPSPVIFNLATLGPLGRVARAPGTVGSLAGVCWFTVVFFPLGWFGYFLTLVLSVYGAVELCGEAERRMFKSDPGEVVLDEFVAVPVCFLGLQPYLSASGYAWAVILAGFLLFRIFDVLKPLGINRLQDLPGGVGVVADDLGAALATCITLHVIIRIYRMGWGW